jgi:hypothetical protein
MSNIAGAVLFLRKGECRRVAFHGIALPRDPVWMKVEFTKKQRASDAMQP